MSDLRVIADTLVAHCRNNTTIEGLKQLYASDAESVEAVTMEGADSPVTKGVQGIQGKHEWWEANFEVHSANVDGPYLHGADQFGVIFELDTTHKESGKREQMKEMAVYTVQDGKIVREQFYYNM